MTNMDQRRFFNSSSLSEKRPSITAEELTPIVFNQLQSTSKWKEENRKLRRGSRSSNSSTPASAHHDQHQDKQEHGKNHLSRLNALDSGSESCGEEARIRTAEAFMSGIQSAISLDGGHTTPNSNGLSAELVGEVDSVLSKLMQSVNRNDPSLIPLIVNLQASLKATIKPEAAEKKDVALSEFSTGNNDFFPTIEAGENCASKIPWKIRAARKRAMKHHTTGMTKDEFAKIKLSLMQSSANFQKTPFLQPYALSRNKSESAIKYYSTRNNETEGGNAGNSMQHPSELQSNAEDELGYASDVCDYNMGDEGANNSPLRNPGRGYLIQPADTLSKSKGQPPNPVASKASSQAYNNDLSPRNSTAMIEDPKCNRKRGTNTGVRAKIARRKRMKDANALDVALGSLSDQEATSEACDEDDSVEEKQDNEPINDVESSKIKSPPKCTLTPNMTPETARRNWNSRFSNIKSTFSNAGSDIDLSRSPSLNPMDTPEEPRGRSQFKKSPPKAAFSPVPPSRIERPQSKEDKDKENSLKAYNATPAVKKMSAPAEYTELSKSKQPTPSRDNFGQSVRATKSMPREGYDEKSRAEVLGLVKATREENGSNATKNADMDYQEYMNIISKVRQTKEFSRARAEHYRLASMYAKEKKRQEELEVEEQRLQSERKKIESETRPKPLPINLVYPTVQSKPAPPPTPVSTTENTAVVQPVQKAYHPSEVTKVTQSLQVPISSSNMTHFHRQPEQAMGIGDEKGQLDKTESELMKNSPSPNTFPPPTTQSNEEEKEAALKEQLAFEEIEKEHKRQQEIRESQVKAEQEKLHKLRQEQIRQERDREEIRRLEIERLRQIQEEQRQLEEERRRQEENIRVEQLRIEEERRRQEKLQAEKNAEYNKQRLELEASNVIMNEGQRAMYDPRSCTMSPHEKILQERLMQQENLRQEHRREEHKIRQEKLKLIQQEELLIARQEDMLHQIEAERLNLFQQEQLIRKRQQERLHQVRQEKQLLEKQEEVIKIREEQLQQERMRQEKLRQEQRALREQEEAIRKRQEQISKELMTANNIISQNNDLLNDQLFMRPDEEKLTDHQQTSSSQDNSSGIIENPEGEDEDDVWSGSGSGSDTIDEEGCYECKVEVKQQNNFTSSWSPVTPYLTYSGKQQNASDQNEVSQIMSHSKPGIITSPESMRTSTNLITTPDSLSLQSQISIEPRSLSSSCSFSPRPQIPPLPFDEPDNELPPMGNTNMLEVPPRSEEKSLSISPRIGGPGSAFKPYASNENLFDPSNFPKRSYTDTNINKSAGQNYPLYNGGRLESKHFMRGKEFRFQQPIHGKVRELKKQTKPPFSTTDTEPEMKECNMSAMDRKRGKQKLPVYSTSETEEEYQAYMGKSKWYGKGGHKDHSSWGSLQAQSPPQITQKPVGVLQKPKPQPANHTAGVERGLQVSVTPIFVPPPQVIELPKPFPIVSNGASITYNKPPLPKAETNGNQFEHPERIQKSDSIIEVRRPISFHPAQFEPIYPDKPQFSNIQKSTSEPVYPEKNHNQAPMSFNQPAAEPEILEKPQGQIDVMKKLANEPIFPEKTQILAPLMQMPPSEAVRIQNQAFSLTQKPTNEPIYPEKVQVSTVPAQKPMAEQIPEKNQSVPYHHTMTQSIYPDRIQNQSLGQNSSLVSSTNVDLMGSKPDLSNNRSPFYEGPKNAVEKLEKSPETNVMEENEKSDEESKTPPKKTTAQQRLQMQLMNEALKKVELKKKHFSNTTRTNPTIAAMEIMTRKEIKAGEMEQRLARGEIPAIPVPTTPENLSANKLAVKSPQQSFFENLAVESKKSPLRRSESVKEDSLTPVKRGAPINIQPQQQQPHVPVILLKKEPKRLSPNEIKSRSEINSQMTPRLKSMSPLIPRMPPHKEKSPEKKKDSAPKVVSAQAQAAAKSAALASTVPKATQVKPKPTQSNAEKAFELLKSEKQQHLKPKIEASEQKHAEIKPVLQQAARSRSIGSNLALKLQIAASFGEEDESKKPTLPWANDQEKQSKYLANAGIKKHMAAKEKGYLLRMSKSSDSITAAKLLAEQKKNEARGLRINSDLSKSVERQLNVYTKSREDIRKMLDAAKACSVQDRIKLFNSQVPICEPEDVVSREEKAEAIRREIIDAKTTNIAPPSDESLSSTGIEIQSPVEAKVKPLRIPFKPKLVESESRSEINSEPGSKLRINQSPGSPKVKSILRTSRSSERSKMMPISLMANSNLAQEISKRTASADGFHPPSGEQKVPKSILVKKLPKLVHANENSDFKIYAQSATDMSATDDEELERYRKLSAPVNGQFLKVPQVESQQRHQDMISLRKSKSFASSSGQFECPLTESEISAKQKTIMAFFDASLNSKGSSKQSYANAMIPVSVNNNSALKRRDSINRKRGSVASISDEIIGNDDLKDVDAVFESLLIGTFQEIQSRNAVVPSKKRSASSHSLARIRAVDVGSDSRSAPTQQESSSIGNNRKLSRNKSVNQHRSTMDANKAAKKDEELKSSGNSKKYAARKANSPPPPPQAQTPSPTLSNTTTDQDNTKNDGHLAPRLSRQASLPSLTEGTDSRQQKTDQTKPNGKGLTPVMRSPSSAKEVILAWVQERTNTYPNLNVTNFSSSWNDGMAFCALIHYYYPEAFDYDKLDPKNRRYNFDLAFKAAEHFADICPLLDVEDMVMMVKPDWKCVFTYVQTFYRRFRNGRDPQSPTRKLTLTPPEQTFSINEKTIESTR